MKRSIACLCLALSAAAAIAQGPFTIVRPLDGAKVREKVHVLLPKDSVPKGGYIGVFLGGKFIEATVPTPAGKYLEYVIDTKGRKIEDGPLKLELVLFAERGDTPRIVNRTSVEVKVSNKANIRVPNAGIKLRYGFRRGSEWVYDVEQRTSIDTISEDQNKLGGRAAELPVDTEKFRLLYAIDNNDPSGHGLVRIQTLPTKGKDYAYITATGNGVRVSQKFMDTDMAPLYMWMTNTGRQIWGSAPLYFPMDGTTGEGTVTDLWSPYPLPTLPERAVRPGDSWQSRFQNGHIDLENIFEQTSLVRTFPARGEFVGVEWEMSHPCAKLENNIEVAQLSEEEKKQVAKGSSFGGEKVSMKETIWFALDIKKIVKIVRDQTVETKVETTSGYGNSGFGAPGGPSGMPGRGGMPGSMGAPGGKDDWTVPMDQRMRGGRSPRGTGGMPTGGYPGGMPGGYPGGPNGFGGAGSQATTQSQFIRMHIQRIFTLEQ